MAKFMVEFDYEVSYMETECVEVEAHTQEEAITLATKGYLDTSNESAELILSETDKARESRIRRLAEKERLFATKSRKDSKWYFANQGNMLKSPEQGLDIVEAENWLRTGETETEADRFLKAVLSVHGKVE